VTGHTEAHGVDPGAVRAPRSSTRRPGGGAIAASYSRDIIARLDGVRPPLIFRGDLWISVCRGRTSQCRATLIGPNAPVSTIARQIFLMVDPVSWLINRDDRLPQGPPSR